MPAWFLIKFNQGDSYVDLEKACHIRFAEATEGQPASVTVYFDEDHRVHTDNPDEVRRIRNWVEGH